MSSRVVGVAVTCIGWTVACSGGSSKPDDERAPDPSRATPPAFTVTESGVGPINATTPVTRDALRALLPDHELEPVDLGLGNTTILVRRGGELLLQISTMDGALETIAVASPQIATSSGWRGGGTLTDPAQLHACTCRGDGLVCFSDASRIALLLDEDCTARLLDGSNADHARYRALRTGQRDALALLAGSKIRFVLWRPQVWRADDW